MISTTLLAHLPTTYTEMGYLFLALVGFLGGGIIALDAANLWLAPANEQVLRQRRQAALLARAAGVLVVSVLAFVAVALFVATWAYRLQ